MRQQLSSLPSSPSSTGTSEQLPFDTCLEWQKQLVAVRGYPLYEIWRSFSWRLPKSEGWRTAHNRVLVCPRCLKQWAHLDFQRPMTLGEPEKCLFPYAAFCGECGPGFNDIPAGSIFPDWGPDNIDLPLLYALPEPLLRRELEIHLRHFEKEIGNGP